MIRAAELAPSRAGLRRITHAPRQARRKAGTHANTPLCTHTHLNTPLCTHRHTHISSRTVHACTLQRHAQRSPMCTHTQICANVPKVCAHACSHRMDWCTIALHISQCVHTHPGHTPLQAFTYPYTHACARPTHAHPCACTCAPSEYLLCPSHTHARYPAPHTLTPIPLCPSGDTRLSLEASGPCPTPHGGGSARSRDFPGGWDEDVYY